MIKQSKAAFPQLIALLNIAETIKFCLLLVMSDRPTAHIPDAIVLKTKRKKSVIKVVGFFVSEYSIK